MPPASPRGLTLLHVLSWLNYGGVESYALRLSRALAARGHRVLVASGGGQLEPEFAAAGIEHFRIDFTGGRGLRGARALRRLLEREQVDLVNAHNWRAGMVSHLATRAAGVPYLLTIHGTRRAWSRHSVFYWSPKVAVVSEASRRNLVDGFGLAEDRVLNTIIGVDCDRFRPGPPEAELEVELGLQPGAPARAPREPLQPPQGSRRADPDRGRGPPGARRARSRSGAGGAGAGGGGGAAGGGGGERAPGASRGGGGGRAGRHRASAEPIHGRRRDGLRRAGGDGRGQAGAGSGQGRLPGPGDRRDVGAGGGDVLRRPPSDGPPRRRAHGGGTAALAGRPRGGGAGRSA